MSVSSINNISNAYEQLSSMKKINSAADNAAGLAIVEKMNSQTNGYDVGNANAKTGQDLISCFYLNPIGNIFEFNNDNGHCNSWF